VENKNKMRRGVGASLAYLGQWPPSTLLCRSVVLWSKGRVPDGAYNSPCTPMTSRSYHVFQILPFAPRTAHRSRYFSTSPSQPNPEAIASALEQAAPQPQPDEKKEGFVNQISKLTKKKPKKMGDTIRQSSGVMVTTRGSVAGHKIIEEVGIVVGSAVKSRHVGQDLWARVLGFFGASVRSYAEMMVDSAAEATYNLMKEAASRGATAVVRVRYETSTSTDPTVWSSTFSYTLAYGTAVKTLPDESILDEGEGPD